MKLWSATARVGLVLVLLAVAACGGSPVSAMKPTPPDLATITVATGDDAGGVAWDGVVQAVEQSVLSAQTTGRVIALGADVDQHVAAGTVLLRITNTEQSAAVQMAQAQLQSAQAQLIDARNRFERASTLVERQLISRDDFDRVKSAFDSTSAAVQAAHGQLAEARQQSDYTTVRAPYAGTVSARSVELGETVAPGQPLFTLYAPGALRLEVQVPQAIAEAIRSRPQATVALADGREVQVAKVIVFPSADSLAHSNAVRVLLPTMSPAPRPGQTAKVRFAGSTGGDQMWLPASAVVIRGELTGAYVVRDDGVVLRQLRLGRVQGGSVEVLAGLASGERVAADPVAALHWLRQRQAQPSHG